MSSNIAETSSGLFVKFFNNIPNLLHWQLQQSCKTQEAASIAGISVRAS